MNVNQGRLAESEFTSVCLRRGLKLYRPESDDHGVDFAIKLKSKFITIQVKSTRQPDKRYENSTSYRFSLKRGHDARTYNPDDFDYLALYIIPRNIWYIIPFSAVLGKKLVRVNPEGNRCSYKQYMDAFELIS